MAVDFLYHYTGRSFIDDILEDCTLWPSHAAWGFGVYLTDIPPRDDNRQRISAVFGRRRFYAERLEAYVRIEREKADADQHLDDPHIFAEFTRCAPSLEELREAFELLRAGPLD